jgi:transcriptional regulator GlxA family with amidase domain
MAACGRIARSPGRGSTWTHLEEPIRISAVAAHAGVDTRTLERYFARGLGVSPKRYLLARRLNSARKRLVAADPERARVTDVAFEHGLTHLGRFPAQYRSYFGEHPRQTLQDR